MKLQQRLEQLPNQERAFMIGSVETIHEQWVFFDEQDEPSALIDIINDSYQIKINNQWETFESFEDGMALGKQVYAVRNGDIFKIQKPLNYVYQEWLNELTDEAFSKLITLLNTLQFSLFDCIYCHNFLFYKVQTKPINGVNFIVFDNGEELCSVHHHFKRGATRSDRFEVTINNGKRHILSSL
ncbi:hypothetical protein JOC85_000570 [Bacillus mesophilus]|uniref:DUF2777 family protein n=1 Tax=Bacillus mesophilus TaxID=1808955 RepID=A0A6M0Q372_9BACI|nr:DUF2777 family protein [Bacillus mesophilus]MBM7659803.1 hypothetical protein [Bacillus mesophilus]NEY70662.1 DUF2777 family protein [Bacillus mesophilus]